MSPTETSTSPPASGRDTTTSWGLASVGTAIAAAAGAYLAFSLRRSAKFRSQVVGIIPARYGSSRFQGKPLVSILGKPMIQDCATRRTIIARGLESGGLYYFASVSSPKRTWERAKLATTLNQLVVATDDEKIAECCRGFGADVIMTSESCRNGTERCNVALLKLKKKFDVVVNIQGDEPLIEPEIIDGVVKALQAAPDAVFSTAVTSLKPEDASDPNRVKCVVDNRGYAIYFSRGLIPFNKSGMVNPHFPYLLHLGIQSYDAKFLKLYPDLSPTPLQLEEDLEQLKVLENGYKMKVFILCLKMVNTRGGRADGAGSSKSKGKGKRQRQQPMEEDLPVEFDRVRFPTAAHQKKYNEKIRSKTLLDERGIEYDDFDFKPYFIRHRWGRLAADPGGAAEMLVNEFYSNGFEKDSYKVHLRGETIDFSSDSINRFLGLRRFGPGEADDYHPLLETEDHQTIADVIGRGGAKWKIQTGGERKFYHTNMKYSAQSLYSFVRHQISPCSHVTWVTWDRGVLVYCIMTDMTINVGKVIHDTIVNMMKEKSKQGLGYGGLITAMARANGVELPDGELLKSPMSMLEMNNPYQADFDARPPHPHPNEARAPGVDRIGALMAETRDWIGRMELRQEEQHNENIEWRERMEGRQERMENWQVRMDGRHEQQRAWIQQMYEWMLRQQGGNLPPPDY